MRRILVFAVAMIAAVASWGARAGEAEDIEALKALDAAYAHNWKEGNAEALMGLFTDDVTAVPHHGVEPILGKEVLRTFWFPAGSPPTVVTRFDHVPAEVIVDGDMGVVRGRFNLTYEYKGTRTTLPEGNYIQISRRTEKGWKIRMFTWNDDPREVVQEPVE